MRKILYVSVLLMILTLTLGAASAEDVADDGDALSASDDAPVAEVDAAGANALSEEEEMPVADLDVDVKYLGETDDKQLEWSVVVTNKGPQSADNVTVFLDSSTNLIVSETTVDHGLTMFEYGVWIVGSLSAKQSGHLLIKTTKEGKGPYYFEALSVEEDSMDPNLGNNYGIATAGGNPGSYGKRYSMMPVADLKVEVRAVKETKNTIEWAVIVTNNGPQTADNTTVYIDMSDNIYVTETFVQQGLTMFEYGIWLVGSIPAKGSAQLLIITQKDGKGPYYLEALTIAFDSYNIKLANNYDMAVVGANNPDKNNSDIPSANPDNDSRETLPATGNPIAMALLALLAVGAGGLKRRF